MRWKRKLIITVLAAAASAIGGTEIAKKRFSKGKGAAYRKFLDKVIGYKNETAGQAADEMKADEAEDEIKEVDAAGADQTTDDSKADNSKADNSKADNSKADGSKADDATAEQK